MGFVNELVKSELTTYKKRIAKKICLMPDGSKVLYTLNPF